MPHVDEGQLHAYLDGELEAVGGSVREVERHIEACAECRRKLEAARRTRDGAAAVLADGAPSDAAPPPFEAVERRAGGGGSVGGASGGGGGWLRGLAWAAVLVVALGMGLLARDMVFEPAAPATESGALPVAQEPARPGEADAARGPAEAAPSRADEAAVGGDPEELDAAAALQAEMTEAAVDELAEQDRAEPPVARIAELEAAGAAESPAANEARREAAQLRRAPAEDAPSRELRQRAVEAFADGEPGARGPWRTVTIAEAGRLLGGPLWVIDGLTIVEVTARTLDGSPVVRTVQRVDDYRMLELIQHRDLEGALIEQMPPAPLQVGLRDAVEPAEITTVTEFRGDSRITVRSTLPANAVETLLERLEQAGS